MAKQADGMPADEKGKTHTHTVPGRYQHFQDGCRQRRVQPGDLLLFFAAVVWRRAATLPPAPEAELLSEHKTGLMNFSNGINICRLNMNELRGDPDREGQWLVGRYWSGISGDTQWSQLKALLLRDLFMELQREVDLRQRARRGGWLAAQLQVLGRFSRCWVKLWRSWANWRYCINREMNFKHDTWGNSTGVKTPSILDFFTFPYIGKLFLFPEFISMGRTFVEIRSLLQSDIFISRVTKLGKMIIFEKYIYIIQWF